MAQHSTAKKGIPLDSLIEAWKENNFLIRPAARALGCDPANVSRRLMTAVLAGDERVDASKVLKVKTKESDVMELIKARAELDMRNERKVSKGDWRKPTVVSRAGEGPMILGLFGDPHLDNSGTDLELFEDALYRLDDKERVFGACVGDFFDNWPRVLGHLYAESGDPAPAWTLFQHWMKEKPFLFSVTGNHDQFASGTANFLDEFMRGRGSLLRRSGGTFYLPLGGGKPISIAMRHIWQGNSQYSEAHPLKRAAAFGHTQEDLVVGGHTHKGEIRQHVRPADGFVSKLVQVSSFKVIDNFANDRGFVSAKTPPIVWCVLDAREPDTSHSRVQPFYSFETAKAVLRQQQDKNYFEAA